jgi:hypothetical protein
MFKMPEKLSTAGSYSIAGILLGIAHWLQGVDWQQVAVISAFILGIATYFTNIYFQRRQLKIMADAAREGKLIIPRPE